MEQSFALALKAKPEYDLMFLLAESSTQIKEVKDVFKVVEGESDVNRH